VDQDNNELSCGENAYPVCYYIACNYKKKVPQLLIYINFFFFLNNEGGNSKYFEISDRTKNELRNKEKLDRETLSDVSVVIEASNNCDRDVTIQPPESCDGIGIINREFVTISIDVTISMNYFREIKEFLLIFLQIDFG